jgi:superfamily II DNA/RNA helicase
VDLIAEIARKTDKITHSIVIVPEDMSRRISALVAIICSQRFTRAIIYGNTVDEVRSIVNHPLLVSRARALHGELDQVERDRILNYFRTSSTKGIGVPDILVCTDVTSRGIDLPAIDLVISLRPPKDASSYVHRAGRTGRYKSEGESILLVSPKEKKSVVSDLESFGQFKFNSLECPSKSTQQDIAIQSLVDEAVKIGSSASEKLKHGIAKILQDHTSSGAAMVECKIAKIMQNLLGDMVYRQEQKRSILSGAVGYVPVLFVDPSRAWIGNRAKLESVCEELKISPGLIALSDSGFVVDLPKPEAIRVSQMVSENEIIILKKLPKLVKDDFMKGRKFRGVLPWRIGKGRGRAIRERTRVA